MPVKPFRLDVEAAVDDGVDEILPWDDALRRRGATAVNVARGHHHGDRRSCDTHAASHGRHLKLVVVESRHLIHARLLPAAGGAADPYTQYRRTRDIDTQQRRD